MPKSDANNMLAVSTTNGFFILKGPDYKQGNRYLKNESVNNVMMTSKGRFVASTLTDGVYTSDDGEKWKQSSRGLHVRKVWAVEEDRHEKFMLYAGTQYGHLFRSKDEADTWEEVTGLFRAPNRNRWGIDWGHGTTGLTIHTIKSDPFKKGRLYIIASGNGVYKTDDNGESWKMLKKGLTNKCPVANRADAPQIPSANTDSKMNSKEHLRMVHSCAHKLAVSEKTEGLLFQQNHCGVYVKKFRTKLERYIS
ncbi:MAG: hypothetical protein QXG05_01545 [Nitrososphaerota archaeon]